MEIRLNIKLHANQQHIQDHAKKYNVIMAGKRFGKTLWALYRALQKAGNCPGGTVWYIAPTYRQAKQIAWRELLKMLPPQLIIRKIETDLLIELWNRCTFQLIGADDEDHLRGVKINHYVLDEASYVREEVRPLLDGQLLGNVESGSADYISSPNKTGTNWFSAFHQDAMRKMKAGDPEWAAFFFTLYDNPTLPRADIEKLKANTPDQVWSLEYMAQESEFAGAKYNEFRYDTHVRPFDFNKDGHLPTYRAIDYGLLHPSVCLWAKVDRPKNMVYIYDEFVRNGLIIEEICRVIKEKTGSTPTEYTVIDPSANRRDIITGRSLKDEFLRCGIACVDGDRRGADEKGGRGTSITKMFFKHGMILIDPRCKNLILELRNLQWGQKEGDDATDALRYLLVRLHDLVFNGVLNSNAQDIPVQANPQIFNINDRNLFPNRGMEYASSIREEINAY